MSKQPLKRKRKIEPNPNPLFVQWLTEWRDEAAEKGWKTQYAFGKALRSLKKYPMPLSSGKSCSILDSFGNKICKMLDKKLEEYVAENGPILRDPSSGMIMVNNTQGSSSIDVSDSDPEPEPEPVPVQTPPGGTPATKKKRKTPDRSPREYVPLHRSGPYALILTLYKNHVKPNSLGFMKRGELMEAAQPLADKSFTRPDPGSYYTAWSSMSTLINKGFVTKEGSPARFSITEKGCELAHKLETVGPGNPPTVTSPLAASPDGRNTASKRAATRMPQLPTMSDDNDDDGDISITARIEPLHQQLEKRERPPTAGQFQFWYIDDRGRKVSMKDSAAVMIDDDLGVGFLVECSRRALESSGRRYKEDHSRPSQGGKVFAFLANENAEDTCTMLTSGSDPNMFSSLSSVASFPGSESSSQTSTTSILSSQRVATSRLPAHQLGAKKLSSVSDRSGSQGSASSNTRKHPTDSQGSTASSSASVRNSDKSFPGSSAASKNSMTISTGVSSAVSASDSRTNSHGSSTASQVSLGTSRGSSALSQGSVTSSQGSLTSSQGSLASSTAEGASSQSTETSPPPEPLFVLHPGEFEVVLCVDNCETAGGSARSQKQVLLPELMRNGVNMDVRKLQVGDFLWVAREKLAPCAGQLKMPERREVVLDYVIERKRMDDLCGSMQDGRFREQKFRLKNCGLRKPIYLVEEYGSSDHLSIPLSTLYQATVNTQNNLGGNSVIKGYLVKFYQVSDGFFVKHTKDIKESVAYLTIMTRYLQSLFSMKTLIAYRKEDLEKMKRPFVLSDKTHQLMTFKEFNQSSVKTKESSINEMFAKQLLQISGLSAEKALAITSMYRTPASLLQAYGTCAMAADREKLLARLKYGRMERNLGPVLSKQIHQLYCTPGALM